MRVLDLRSTVVKVIILGKILPSIQSFAEPVMISVLMQVSVHTDSDRLGSAAITRTDLLNIRRYTFLIETHVESSTVTPANITHATSIS